MEVSTTKRNRRASLGLAVACLLGAQSIGLGAIPAAPGNLTASVNGSTVTLSWLAPAGQVLGYRIEAGTAPGLNNVTSALTGPATSLTAPNVPPGTYYVRVRAIAADGEGPASNEAGVTVGAAGPCAGPPGAPANLAASLNGSTVTFNWTAGGGCPALNYVLQAGSGPGMSNLAVANVGAAQTLSASAPPGTYYVRVLAQNGYGTSAPSNQEVVTIGAPGGGTGPVTLTPLAGSVTSWGWRILPVTMPASGEYRATLTWADASIDLDLYLTTTSCSSYPPSTSCRLASSRAVHTNLEQISFPVQAGQTYYVWIDSFSGRVSDYLVQHTINGAALTAPGAGEPDQFAITKSKQ